MFSSSKLKKLDEEFQLCQLNWHETKGKSEWDRMFILTHFAVSNSIKKRLKRIKRDDFDDLCLEATAQIMNRYVKNENYNINYLPCIASYAAIQVLYNDKQKFQDSVLSLDEIQENYNKDK